MFALSLDQAKTVAVVVAVILLVAAAVSAWVMKQIVQKLVVAGVFIILAVVVWTQRTSLQDCADQVRTTRGSAECSFFGQDVTVNTSLRNG